MNVSLITKVKAPKFEASEPKGVNPILDIIGPNSVRLGGIQLMMLQKNINYH